MKEVTVKTLDYKLYRRFMTPEQSKEMQLLAHNLQGKKIYFINSTNFGGGVAELFYSLVPIINSLGIDLHWYVIEGDSHFFEITKKLHNLLQGQKGKLTKEEINYYLEVNKKNAQDFILPVDLVVIHDPQPMSLPSFIENASDLKLVWRCHIDTSCPNSWAKKFITSFTPLYDKAIFSLPSFARGLGIRNKKVIIYPSIDPLSPKNKSLSLKESRFIVQKFGINLRSPFLLQVSRFDPWKDPLGVIKVYQILKKEFPGLQLVLIGSLAHDDPEGERLYKKIKKYSSADKNIFVLTNNEGVGNIEVNAFQKTATVVLQKSLREGFGLTVAESLWKGKAVIGGKVGGISKQIHSRRNGYLVSSIEECVRRARVLLSDEKKRKMFGEEGFLTVKHQFLLPRHILDYLQLFDQLLSSREK